MVKTAREIILSRRARFVAAALVGVAAVGCGSEPQVCLEPTPQMCLSIAAPIGDAASEDGTTGPVVCLSVGPPVEAGSDAGDDAG